MATLRSTIACHDDDGNLWSVEQVVGDMGLVFEVVAPDGSRRRLTPVARVFDDVVPPALRPRRDAEEPLPLDLS